MDEGLFVFRLQGDQSLAVAVQQVDDALRRARGQGARRALIDVRELTGFARPGLVARMDMVRRWAATVGGEVKVAVVSRRELNDPERFDVVLAGSLGITADVFETEPAALAWLQEQPALWTGPPPAF